MVLSHWAVLLVAGLTACGTGSALVDAGADLGDDLSGMDLAVADAGPCPPVIELRDFGALGQGVASYLADTAALRMAVAHIASCGGGALHVAPGLYAFSGAGIPLPDHITIYGDGPTSEIRHVNPGDDGGLGGFRGVIFFQTTYGPFANMKAPMYKLLDVAAGAQSVTLVDAADAANLAVGRVIQLGGHKSYKDVPTSYGPYFSQVEMNEVTSINGATIGLKYATSMAYTSDSATTEAGFVTPLLVDLNNPATAPMSFLGIRHFLSKDVVVHDLKLSQAQTDEVHGGPLMLPSGVEPSTVIKEGGFDSEFHHLTIESYSAFPGGNMLCRSSFHDIDTTSSLKLFDFGYASNNLVVHDLAWHYAPPSVPDPESLTMVYVNQACHDIAAYNITVDGSWNGNNLIVVAEAAHDVDFHDWTVKLPAYNQPTNQALVFTDDGNPIWIRDIKLTRFDLELATIGSFIRGKESTAASPARNIVFTDVTFKGTASQVPVKLDADFGALTFSNVTLNGSPLSQ
jgi:hypothetical protein